MTVRNSMINWRIQLSSSPGISRVFHSISKTLNAQMLNTCTGNYLSPVSSKTFVYFDTNEGVIVGYNWFNGAFAYFHCLPSLWTPRNKFKGDLFNLLLISTVYRVSEHQETHSKLIYSTSKYLFKLQIYLNIC